jgi:hypothetical protein
MPTLIFEIMTQEALKFSHTPPVNATWRAEPEDGKKWRVDYSKRVDGTYQYEAPEREYTGELGTRGPKHRYWPFTVS